MGLSNDIKAFTDKAVKAMSDNTNKIVEDLFTAAVDYSPSPTRDPTGRYARGLLVNQWYFSVGAPSSEVGSSLSDSGTDSIARIREIASVLPFNGKDNSVYLSNNTEEAYYANKLGWQRGQGNNGWIWAGASAYYMADKAISYIQGKYS